MAKTLLIRVLFICLILLFTAFLAIAESFSDKATALCQRDFSAQDIRLSFDYPERLQRLSEKDEIIDFKNMHDGRVQFLVKGDSKPITARVDIMVDIPVLTHPISSTSTITDEDISTMKIPSSKLQGSIVLKKEDIVGKKPKSRTLQAMTAIQGNDLENPVAIKRDAIIRLIYIAGNLKLTTHAKALKDGSVGQRIPFETTGKIKKHLDATVVDGSTAEVRINL